MLTVTGDIGTTNAPGSARFDIGMLAQIGKESFTTSTIWTEGELEFTGTPLASLLKVLGVNEGSVRAMALNDYVATIPVDEVSKDVPLLAWQIDGEELPVRKRGPIWIVYPYDAGPEFRSDTIYGRSVWQLFQLEVIRGPEE